MITNMKKFLHELDFWFFWIIPSYIPKGKLTLLLQEMLPKTQIFHCWAAWWIKSHDSNYLMHWRILLIGTQLLLFYKFLVYDNIRCVSQYQVPAVDNANFEFWQHLLMAGHINAEIAQYERKNFFCSNLFYSTNGICNSSIVDMNSFTQQKFVLLHSIAK